MRLWEGKRQFALVRWGLMPSWVKDPRNFAQLHNARADSVLDKPAFRNAIRYRRCLFIADGFYEWPPGGDGRIKPHFVRLTSGAPMAFAGLWEAWTGPNGEEFESAAIITTEANRTLAHVHHRMPVIVPPEAFDFWLDCRHVEAQMATALLVPAPDDAVEIYPVSPAVNRTANDSAELMLPYDASTEPAPPSLAPRKVLKEPKLDDGQASLF